MKRLPRLPIIEDIAMRELAQTHRAYKAFLASEDTDAAEQRHLYRAYCNARDVVVSLAEQMFPSGATRRRPA